MNHVFISYSRKDQIHARRVAEDLRQHGFDVWMDDRIDYGDRWLRVIFQAVRDAAAVIVIMSPHSEESKWVEKEYLFADEIRKPILPLALDGHVFPYFVNVQIGKFTSGSGLADDLFARLEQIVPPKDATGEIIVAPHPTPTTNARPATIQSRPLWIAGALGIVGLVIAGILLASGVFDGGDEQASGDSDTPTTASTATATPSEPTTATPSPTSTRQSGPTPEVSQEPNRTSETPVFLPATTELASQIPESPIAPDSETPVFLPATTELASQIPESPIAPNDGTSDIDSLIPAGGFVTAAEGSVVALYAFEGRCKAISPDLKRIALTDGIYDLATRATLSGIRLSEYNPALFSPDGSLVVSPYDAVYEVTTGLPRFNITGNNPVFSPDGLLLALTGDGVYDLATGTRRFAIAGGQPVFSPDGSLVAVAADGVYEVATGVRLVGITGYDPVFSPDGNLIAVSRGGLYDLANEQQRFRFSGSYPVFSPDGQWLAVGNDGLYDTATGTRRITFSGYGQSFSPDSTLVVADEDGVYEVASGTRRFAIAGSRAEFSPDGSRLVVADDGVYDVATGERQFSVGNIDIGDPTVKFDADSTVVMIEGDGIYDLATGEKRSPIGEFDFELGFTLMAESIFVGVGGGEYGYYCFVFGSDQNAVLGTSLVHVPEGVNIRTTPNGDVTRTSPGEDTALLDVSGDWLKIGEDEWVYYHVVEVEYIRRQILNPPFQETPE